MSPGDKLPFQEECFMQVPKDMYGVYALWASAEVLYFGVATPEDGSIREWLIAHKKRRDDAKKRCPYHPAAFQWEENRNPFERRKELLEVYHKQNGVLPLCNKPVGR